MTSLEPRSLDVLDRLAVAYLTLPLAIFLGGWLEAWAAVPLILCLLYSLRPLVTALPAGGAGLPSARRPAAPPSASRWPVSRLQLMVAVAVGCVWTAWGGIGHLVFANADWHLRDAVLHDLVIGRWPVGYGPLGGAESLLRAPIGYYLPAALIGKSAGLPAAHAAMTAWTALGATLFLLQVLSQTPSRLGTALAVATVIVFFSGLDIIGTLMRVPGLIPRWDVTRHLEWWAGSYQYSSMTTQLFWVPNHALPGWLGMGLLCRKPQRSALEALLPIVVAAAALWSPLTALGLAPFVLWRLGEALVRDHSFRAAYPLVWAPALAIGAVVAAYLTLDTAQIPRSWTLGRNGSGIAALAMDVWNQAEFFLLEAGLIGFAVLAIRRRAEIALALVLLALLPAASFGAANDLVMRVSIPSLTALAIGACLALTPDARCAARAVGAPGVGVGAVAVNVGAATANGAAMVTKKAVLAGLLALGAVTPFQELARAVLLPAWPINLEATLVGAACGQYPPHYVARLREQSMLAHLLRPPHPLAPEPEGARSCENPAITLERTRALERARGVARARRDS